MKIYRVGGAVRDALLGLPVKDIDYLVLGSTPEQMVAAGFTPVGKDFPVFLHPKTQAEYALARTERKSAPGYHGFVFHCAPDVTIEQDLQRRDLTINAMAIAEDTGESDALNSVIIDPFGGQKDLAEKIFRHVSAAFSEDPVRILRVARFAARFNEFTVAPETIHLMRAMVTAGEVDALVPERVWQEIARGLMEAQPSRMMLVLRESGTLARIMPELDAIWDDSGSESELGMLQIVDNTAQRGLSLAVRWAALLSDLAGTANLAQQLCARLKVPTEVRDITLMALREQTQIELAITLTAEAIVQLFERCDAFRRPARFIEMLQAALCRQVTWPAPQLAYLEHALATAQAVPSGQIAQATAQLFPKQPQQIASAIAAARVDAIRYFTD
ncbi:multifunctional CCA tRNA nucleotidyl transferase/2'3'-cyclic phosphodiesterase/2'nucleotidase/phosphatase [Solimicrobium silvestre]|uniref:tRNA nucleotidyltransferase/poly(A) polymerase n=1 Tax=Solimicrobium silvestre TaxID=2099400 RepID=A0A2S9H2L6_9BURK|nr:multifunctional CCA tRNA nucleotidyl transferase/2'3'-cyclic phosphodiesterase/2'nucleotidase/phosphatase [Solimicrobium silvestre]PRC94197.1 tRNA nucleotidyltransferase/poly(A) polymerase [Solimicrobium silvestre]